MIAASPPMSGVQKLTMPAIKLARPKPLVIDGAKRYDGVWDTQHLPFYGADVAGWEAGGVSEASKVKVEIFQASPFLTWCTV